MVTAPLTESTDPKIEAGCPISCICCWLVELLFKAITKDTLNEVHESKKSSDELFEDMNQSNECQTKAFRWVSWLGSTLGHFLLFMPIIKLLAWIPLVGTLLASVLGAAAFLFALIWATALHFLVMGLAWLFYRPVYGILLLTVFGVLFGMIFCM